MDNNSFFSYVLNAWTILCLTICVLSIWRMYNLSPAWRVVWVLFLGSFIMAPVSRLFGVMTGLACPDNMVEFLFLRLFPIIGNTFLAAALFLQYRIFSRYLRGNGIKPSLIEDDKHI
jgi:hypothetical protein